MTTQAKVQVLVVGAGFGGLTAAIEAQRRGMQATLIEKYENSSQYGDIIDFYANAGRIIERWDNGKVTDELLAMCITEAKHMRMLKANGDLIHLDPWYHELSHERLQFAGQRGKMWEVLFKYATRLGVQMRFGSGVVDYFEDDSKAGVVLTNGERLEGDCVLAGDGPKSLARQKVLGLQDKKTNSGFAIFRSYFPIDEEVRSNPLLQEYLNKEEDIIKIWIHQNSHMLAYSWNKGTQFAWVLTHPDDDDIQESWSFKANKNDVLKFLKDYHPECHAILDVTPPENLIDYKLIWRDALKTWLSPKYRIVLIGDAAHCHLPTSGQGGSQAMEDGAVAAVCLQKARGDVPLALRVMERIRFNRSHATHQAGSAIRELWHGDNWEVFDAEPDKVAQARNDWVLDFDPVKNAEDYFEQLAEDVRSGKPGTIEELALPAGGHYDAML
ncbi:salicylate hydroxylase [Thozetella sp. PMI_491]|nr:salicylate hydroxylase [Thozetella sp. PMI_491]